MGVSLYCIGQCAHPSSGIHRVNIPLCHGSHALGILPWPLAQLQEGFGINDRRKQVKVRPIGLVILSQISRLVQISSRLVVEQNLPHSVRSPVFEKRVRVAHKVGATKKNPSPTCVHVLAPHPKNMNVLQCFPLPPPCFSTSQTWIARVPFLSRIRMKNARPYTWTRFSKPDTRVSYPCDDRWCRGNPHHFRLQDSTFGRAYK